MATYYSDLWRLGRAAFESDVDSIACTVRIPDGTAIAENDVIKLVNLPAGTLVTSVVQEIPVDIATTIASSTLNLGSVAVTGDLALGVNTCTSPALATTNAYSATDDDLKITVGAVTSGTTTAGRKLHYVIGIARFKDNTVAYDWNGLASERIDGVRYSDTESTSG